MKVVQDDLTKIFRDKIRKNVEKTRKNGPPKKGENPPEKVQSRFGPKKRQKTRLIAPLAKRKVKNDRVPRPFFSLARNGGVGGEQSGDFFFGSKMADFCVFGGDPPPILGVDIIPGGVVFTFYTGMLQHI